MDRDGWLELSIRGMKHAFRSFVQSAGGEVIERDGVVAIVNPSVRERSVFNSVVYSDPSGLAAIRGELADTYARHGCAWTVWIPGEDTEIAAELERAGHHLDAEPRAMGMELDAVADPDLGSIEWERLADLTEAGLLNDRAYGYPDGTWLRGIGADPEGLITYLARLDGEPASTVAAWHHEGDCTVWSVATADRARGRGLATALMRQALWDAAQAGCATTTLQATKLGAPVYRGLGYRDFGALQMWEFRPPGLGA